MTGLMQGGSSKGKKPGDWTCSECGDLQFARNATCRRCGAERPADLPSNTKPGDWYCPECNDHQFAKNSVCRKCGAPNPDPDGSNNAMIEAKEARESKASQEKPGDWYCPNCGDLQFARNTVCRQCKTPNPDPDAAQAFQGPARPAPQKKPGDWHCSSCGDLQFARNMECRRCGTPNYAAMFEGTYGKGKGKGAGVVFPGKGCKGFKGGKEYGRPY